jgi:site-specific DNA recombinase
MYGNTRGSGSGRGNSRYSSYRCSNNAQRKGCENKELRREYIDNYVLDQLYDRLFSDNSIKKLSAMLSEYNRKKTIESNEELNIYLKQLLEVNNKITNIINLVSESQISINTVKDNLKELEERKIFYEAQIKNIGETIKMSAVNESMIQNLAEKSRDFIKAKNIPECRNFIENYVKKVLVYNDRVEVIFKIHVPSDDNNAVAVPLISQEVIKTIQCKIYFLAHKNVTIRTKYIDWLRRSQQMPKAD